MEPGSSGITEEWTTKDLEEENMMAPSNLVDPVSSSDFLEVADKEEPVDGVAEMALLRVKLEEEKMMAANNLADPLSTNDFLEVASKEEPGDDVTNAGDDVTEMARPRTKVKLEEEGTSGPSGPEDVNHKVPGTSENVIIKDERPEDKGDEWKVDSEQVTFGKGSGDGVTMTDDDFTVEVGKCPWKQKELEVPDTSNADDKPCIDYFRVARVNTVDALKISSSQEELMDANGELQDDKSPDNLNDEAGYSGRQAPMQSGEKPLSCDICEYGTNKTSKLKQHVGIHAGERNYTCDAGDSGFCQITILENHMKTHTSEKSFACSICDKKLIDASGLRRHMKVHTDERPYVCNFCDSKYKDRQSLRKHVRKHTGERPYACPLCDEKYSDSGLLRIHLRIHIGERFECDSCDKKYRDPSGLRKHKKNSHSSGQASTQVREEPFQCHVCEYRATCPSTMKNHMMIHTGEKPFVCNSCDSRFMYNNDLTRHVRTHTGEKPFPCNTCDSRFRYKCDLKTHMRAHTGEKPFVCNLCDKKYRDAQSLRIHMRNHTGERVECESCGKKYRAAKTLRKHKKSAHCGGDCGNSRNITITEGQTKSVAVEDDCKMEDMTSDSSADLSSSRAPLQVTITEKSGDDVTMRGDDATVEVAEHALKNEELREPEHDGPSGESHCGHIEIKLEDTPNAEGRTVYYVSDPLKMSPYQEELMDTYVQLKRDESPAQGSSDAVNFAGKASSQAREQPFPCHLSEYSAFCASKVKNHMRTDTGEKPLACNTDDPTFGYENDLTRHVRTPTVEKQFPCNTCDVVCRYKSDFRRHLRIHTGEKPFSCAFCEFRTNRACNLKTHVRAHTGEKPFVCNTCDKKYRDATELKVHMRNHTGERSECDLCGKKYRDARGVRRHKKSTRCGRNPENSGNLTKRVMTSDSSVHLASNSTSWQITTTEKSGGDVNMRGIHRAVEAGECPLKNEELSELEDAGSSVESHYGHIVNKSEDIPNAEDSTVDVRDPLMMSPQKEIMDAYVELKHESPVQGSSDPVNLSVQAYLERPFVCYLCGEKFVDASGLRKHKMSSHSSGDPGNSRNRATIESHLRNVELEEECRLEDMPSDLVKSRSNSGWHVTSEEESTDDLTVEDGERHWKREELNEPEVAAPSGQPGYGLKEINIQSTANAEEASIDYFKDPTQNANDALEISRSQGKDANAEVQKDESPISRRSEADDVMRPAPAQSGEKPYSCELCGYRPTRPDRLKHHMRIHTGEKPFACYTCECRFSYKSDLKRHVRTHTGEKPFSCDFCKFRTTRMHSLKMHMKTHINEMPFHCEQCDFRSCAAETLEEHVKTHTGEQPFACDSCNYTCDKGSLLKKHIRTHNNEKRFACNLCEYRSRFSGHLKSHMMTHTGEKPFACHLCDYKCRIAGSLRSHMRTHTGEKPFACNLCDYRSSEKSNLFHHMKTHTGEKPFICEFCDYRSSNASNLRTHIRTHTDEKPFVCDVCNYRFSEAGSLRRHMKTHAREKPHV